MQQKTRLFLQSFLWLFCCLPYMAAAQDSTHTHSTCDFSRDFMLSLGVSSPGVGATAAFTPPGTFPASAKDTCGKFIVYYEDKRPGLGIGFGDATYGAARRSTMCAALNYIQTVFDCSNVPAGQYIRLHVDTSFAYPLRPTSDTFLYTLGRCGPYYNSTAAVTGAVLNGFVWDYIKSASHTDPNPGDYHANLTMNFGIMYPPSIDLSRGIALGPTAINYTTGTGAADACTFSLYSTLLHQLSHALGWFSWHDRYSTHIPMTITGPKSNYDNSLNIIPVPKTTADPFGSIGSFWSTTLTSGIICINSQRPPYNCFAYGTNSFTGISEFSHLIAGNTYYSRITPGDEYAPVMAKLLLEGQNIHYYTKQELLHWRDVVGLPINTSYVTANFNLFNNRLPWSSKMISDAYNFGYDEQLFADTVTADFTLQNNTGATLSISLASDATLHDDDGDALSVAAGTLVNLRGCGSGGNNHNQLSLSPDGKTITFTPRHNFYGRAQFGFNLWDGKEKGAFVIYTIDVTKGTNVAVTKGDNMVVNGNFEEGSEVKTLGAGEAINNSFSILPFGTAAPRLGQGTTLSDGHPFDVSANYGYGTAVRNSFGECSYAAGKIGFGHPAASFPWTPVPPATAVWSLISHAYSDGFPESKTMSGDNNRYQPLGENGILLNLLDTMKSCARYTLEFDARRTYHSPMTSPSPPFIYPSTETFTLDFTRPDLVSALGTVVPAKTISYSLAGIDGTTWQHIKIDFTYCAPATSSMLRLKIAGAVSTHEMIATTLVDNISLTESDLLTTMRIGDSVTGSCSHRLYAGSASALPCSSVNYSWRSSATGSTIISTAYALNISPMDTTTYYVTVSDGCNTISDSLRIIPCRCAPSRVFSTRGYTTLTGTVGSSLAAGYYYVPGHIDISGSPTWDNVKMLMAPNADVSVNNNAILYLSGSHLFTCPDTNMLWKGISLASGGSTSGRIEVTRNTLIEDAVTAITAIAPKRPGSGYVIKTDTAIFNRNMTAIAIENFRDSSSTNYPFLFRSTVFTSRNLSVTSGFPFQWPHAKALRGYYNNTAATAPINISKDYALQNTKTSLPAFAGIRLTDVGVTRKATGAYYDIMIGDVGDSSCRNTFDNTGDGIYARNSNIRMCNNNFINLSKYPPTGPIVLGTPAPSGIGVFTKGAGADVHLNLYKVNLAGNSLLRNRFYDCVYGVYAQDCYELDDTGALFQTSNTVATARMQGVYFSAARYKVANITDNDFYNVPTSISLGSSSGLPGYTLGAVNVVGNHINAHPASPVSYSSAHTAQLGIFGSATTYSAPGPTGGDWMIANNVLTDVYNGINITYMQKQRVLSHSNTINLARDPAKAAQYGIRYDNSLNASLNSNSIIIPGSPSITDDNVRAVYMAENIGSTIRCNVESNVGRGYDFLGTQPLTVWQGNTMDNNMKGLVLSGPIDAQGSYSRSCWAKWTTSGWGAPKFQTYATIASWFSPLYVRTSLVVGPTTEVPVENGNSVPGLRYDMTSGGLKITQVSGTDPCLPPFPSTKPSVSSPATSTTLSTSFKLSPLGFFRFDVASQWIAQYGVYRAGGIDSVVNDTLQPAIAQIRTAMAGTRFEWLGQIEDALAQGDDVQAEFLLQHQVAAKGSFMIDTLVIMDSTEADHIVDNYIRFYGICLDQLRGLDPDSADLADLSYRCPLSDGAVVYQARSLYNQLFGNNVMFDEDQLCGITYNDQDNFRVSKGDVQPIQAYRLAPNPNNGQFSIQQTITDSEPVKICIYNIEGRIMYRDQLIFHGSSAKLQTGIMMPGLYLLQLSDSKGRIFNIKFNVQ